MHSVDAVVVLIGFLPWASPWETHPDPGPQEIRS